MIPDGDLLLDVVAFDEDGKQFYPFVGVRGDKAGRFSVNLESENAGNFLPYTEAELIGLLISGAFVSRGRIRMVRRGASTRSSAKAYAPVLYKGKPVR